MTKVDSVVRAQRAELPGGQTAAAIGMRDGAIVAVAAPGPAGDALAASAGRVVDIDAEYGPGVVLLPGLVDTHVHVNEPGRTEWEGFESATLAAAAGGITTILDMPLNSIPATTTVSALQIKRAAARSRVHVDVGFWGGAVPGNVDDLAPMLAAGVFGFKCFLLPSGVPEFGHLADGDLRQALARLADLDGLLLVHAEDEATIAAAARPAGRVFADFVAGRPDQAEVTAVARVIAAAADTGARVHIVHVAAAAVVDLLVEARQRGVRITAETCPHYLTFAAEELPDGAPQFKCCPPIRGRTDRDLLWQAVAAGHLDIVVSDHSPCTTALKRFDTGDLDEAWGGIASIQVSLPAVWTGARARGFAPADVVRWMASGPADLARLPRKGRIQVGADADFCVFDPAGTTPVSAAELLHRNPVSAYDGLVLDGAVRAAYLGGQLVDGHTARGRLLNGGGM